MNEIELVRRVERIVRETTPESRAMYLFTDMTDREIELAQVAVMRSDRPDVKVARGSIHLPFPVRLDPDQVTGTFRLLT